MISRLSALSWTKLAVAAGLGLAPLAAAAAPANDDIANAVAIGALTGSVSGANTGATLETNEPDFLNTDDYASLDNSVWYQWTAPADGVVTFDTFGSGFDTILAVYTNSFTDPIVAGNDDYITGIIPQSVTSFRVTAGTSYYVSVNGNAYPQAGYADSGNFVLNWSETVPTIPSGDFLFTSANYVVGDSDMFSPQSVPMAVVPPVIGARVTVTRTNGYSGRVEVPYTVVWPDLATVAVVADTNGVTTSSVTNIINPAVTNTGTLVFDDYQMSSDIIVPVPNLPPSLTTLGTNAPFPYAPPYPVSVTLGTPALDPQESPQLLPPVAAAPIDGGATAVTVLSDVYPPTAVSGLFFNVERSTFRVHRAISNAVVYVSITRIPGQSEGTYTVDYRIDHYSDPIGGNNTFPLQAGSDYATPDDDFGDVAGTLSWSSTSLSTTLPIVIPINAATNVTFNEDFEVELFNPQRNGQGPPALLGQVNVADVTILSDKQPAGAVDRTWNKDGFNDSIPPFLNYPGTKGGVSDGANGNGGTVYGAVTQPDGKTIIVGSFISFDSNPYNRIVRLLSNGYQDPAFQGNFAPWNNRGANDLISCVALQPDGKILIGGNFTSYNGVDRQHIARLNSDGTLDGTFQPGLGANGAIWTMKLQASGQVLIGGDFTSYNGTNCNYLAQLNPDGSLDTSFQSGAQLNGPVYALALDMTNSIETINVSRSGAGTNSQDVFPVNLGQSTAGALTVNYSFGAETNELRVYYGGDNGTAGTGVLLYDSGVTNGSARVTIPFGPVNGISANYVTFDMNQGNDQLGSNWQYSAAITLTNSGFSKVYAGGAFTQIDGVDYGGVARFNGNGLVDPTFTPGIGSYNPLSGLTDPVNALAVQADGKLLAGGSFSFVQLLAANGLVRYDTNGTVDIAFGALGEANGTYSPFTGTADSVNAITLQPDGGILIGGDFTTVNQTRRVGVARLYANGAVDTTFMDTAYNQFAGLINHYYSQDANNPADYPQGNYRNAVKTISLTPNGNVIIGGNFLQVGGGSYGHSGSIDPVVGLSFNPNGNNPYGPLQQGITYSGRMDVHPRSNVAQLIGGVTPGPGNIELSYDRYSVDENAGSLFVSLVRTNGNLGDAYAEFFSPPLAVGQQSVATEGLDFLVGNPAPTWPSRWNASWMVSDAYTGPNYQTGAGSESLTIFNNNQITGNLTASLGLAKPYSAFYLGGEFIPLGTALGYQQSAPLTIIDDNFPAGTFGFSAPSYTVNQSSNVMAITVTRTDGSGGTVQVSYRTFDGSAVSPTDYTSVNGVLTFNQGDTSKSFTIPINPTTVKQPDKTVNLSLFSITGGGKAGLTNAVLTLVNNTYPPGHIAFAFATNGVNEDAGSAAIVVRRLGGSAATIDVTLTATGGSAVNGVNFIATTNQLHWNSGVSQPQTVNIPVLHDGIFTSNLTVNLTLSNGRVNNTQNGDVLGLSILTNSTLVVSNVDFPGQVEFTAGAYSVKKYGGYALIPVIRTGGSAGTLSVNYSTLDGSAIQGVNYTATSGVLTFTNGVVSQYFKVPINGASTNNGLLSLSVVLTNAVVLNHPEATNGLGQPNLAALNIIDSDQVDETPGAVDSTFNPGAGFNGPVFAIAQAQPGVSGTNITRSGSGATENVKPVALGATDGTLSLLYNFNFGGNDLRVFYGDTNTGVLVYDTGLTNAIGRVTIPFGPTNGVTTNLLTLVVNQGGGLPFSVWNYSAVILTPNGPGTQVPFYVAGDFTQANAVPRQRIARLTADGVLDDTFLSPSSAWGANGQIRALAVQPDNRIVIGGVFTNFNSTVVNYLARLNYDGSLDSSFNLGSGADNPVYAVAISPVDGKILVGGAFSKFNGAFYNGICRLNQDGTTDTTFQPGSGGANDTVYAVAVQKDGKVIIGGDFTSFAGVPRNHLARLNTDGSLDPSFDLGTGASDSVRAIAIQLDGRILIGGSFTNYDGVALNRIARLNADGTVDTSFTPGAGANDTVSCIALQSDNRIVLGGLFTRFSGVTRNYLTRLNPDGTVDPTINFGAGADDFVAALAVQDSNIQGYPAAVPDEKIIIGGAFTHFNGQTHNRLARIFGGSITGVGAFTLDQANYQIDENSVIPAKINVYRTGGTSGPNPDGSGNVIVPFATSNLTAVAGVNYSAVATNLVFAPGEVVQTVLVPVMDDGVLTSNLTVQLAINPAPPAQAGDQPTAVLTIINSSVVNFSATAYQVPKNIPTAKADINLVRQGSTSGTSTVYFNTTTNGTAVPGIDYTPVTNAPVTFLPGVTNVVVSVPVINNNLAQGARTVTMMITNAVGASIYAPSNATLTIVDTVYAPGVLGFASTNVTFSESDPAATLTVVRTNGFSGTVTAAYTIYPGTALPGINYQPVNGTVTFADGVTSRLITVPLVNNNAVQGTVNFSVALSNPTGGATFSSDTNAVVNILDNDSGVAFALATNSAPETIGAIPITVQRVGATNLVAAVNYATADGTAHNGVNYVSTSGALSFAPGELSKVVYVPLINDTNATGDLSFTVGLSNPSANVQLANPSNTVVVVQDAQAGLHFNTNTQTVLKNAGAVTVTVVCDNPRVEPVILTTNDVPLQVSYSTADGSAVAGQDYMAVSGTLVFTNGMATNTFTVPILNNGFVNSDKTFTVSLSNPTAPGQVVTPGVQSIVIADSNPGLRFSQPSYSVYKNGINATITVLRTGFTNSTVSVNYIATNGTAINGVNFVATGGTLIFTNGETSQSFNVAIINNNVVQPDLTVLLQLFSPTNGLLVSPSAATLSILENSGSYVIPAGAQMVTNYTSGLTDNIIYSNNTVQVLFAFRAAAGLNVTNLVAYLQPGNGVSAPSPASQAYGPLTVHGHSVSQPFTFTANGTNGGTIRPTFVLKDNATAIGTNQFTFTIGAWTTSFTNPALITINDNAAASPYPSVINVSGVGGTVVKTRVSLRALTHTSPSDIDALVVAPSGADTLIMAHAGSQLPVTNIVLTFDDAAATSLPYSTRLTTSTNKPTQFNYVRPFP